jgi:uncharacterized protein YecE (DUF72 family)
VGRIVVGCSGFPVARASYWRELEAVEVQQTFYDPPSPDTAARWRAEAPPGARFAIKVWQLVTHPASSPTYRRLRRPLPAAAREAVGWLRLNRFTREAWARTLAVAGACRAEVLVLQTPPSFGPDAARNLERFLAAVPRDGLAVAWEWRGSWKREEALALCQRLDLVPALDPFLQETPGAGPCYLRLHGGPGYRHRFTEDELAWLAGRLPRRGAVWVMFNNLSMWDDARAFRQLLAERRAR